MGARACLEEKEGVGGGSGGGVLGALRLTVGARREKSANYRLATDHSGAPHAWRAALSLCYIFVDIILDIFKDVCFFLDSDITK